MSDASAGQVDLPLKPMSRTQRRVLGVLIEKAFTTPEYYPLTLKAVTTGCNQKNNRDPVTQYTEDEVEEALNQLREAGVVAVVHTETGRTERWRHWMRRRLTISEAQLAILGELLLRGRQALGELRSRASRMILIESLEQLRTELKGLMDRQLARADGHLERRGAEVDHALYEPREQQSQPLRPVNDEPGGDAPAARGATAREHPAQSGSKPTPLPVEFINPPELCPTFGWTHVVAASGGKVIHISGQVGVDERGQIAGRDMPSQTERAFGNVAIALRAAGAAFGDIVKMNIYVVGLRPEHVPVIREVRSRYVSAENPPASTLVGVSALVSPDWLIEIEATAVVAK